MASVAQVVLNGLITGSIYVLVALSVALLFGTLGIPDFSQGAVFMLGAFASFFLVSDLGLSLFVALPIAMVLMGIFGAIVGRVVFGRLHGRSDVALLVLALGLALLYQNLVSVFWTSRNHSFPFPELLSQSFSLFGASTSYMNLLTVVISIATVGAIFVFTRYTLTGTAIRAVSQDREVAYLMGIDVERISMLTFGIASALSAMAGGLLGSLFSIHAFMGTDQILRAFVIIIIGGTSVIGAAVAGFFLGLVESFSSIYISGKFTTAIVFAVVILILVARPTGLGGGP